MYVVKSLNLINLHTLHAYIFMWWENLILFLANFQCTAILLTRVIRVYVLLISKSLYPLANMLPLPHPVTWKSSLCFMFLRLQHFSYKWEQAVLVWLALHSSISRLIHEAAIAVFPSFGRHLCPSSIGVGTHVFLSHIFISHSIDISNI